MTKRILNLLIICIGITNLSFSKNNQAIEAIFVGNNKGGTVSIIDAKSLSVIATLDVIPDKVAQAKITQTPINQQVNELLGPKYVDDLDVLPDGQTLIVSRPYFADIAAFDLNTQTLLWTLPLGKRPDHQVLTKDGKHLFVSLLANNEGVKIDLEKRQIIGTYPTGEQPHSIVLNADESLLYNGALEGNNMVVVNTQTLEVVEDLPFPEGVRPFKLLDNGNALAQISFFHGLVEYDLAQQKVIREVELPIPDFVKAIPLEKYPFFAAHHGIGIAPNKQFASVAGTVSNYVAFLSFPDLKLIKTLDAGIEPSWITNGFDEDTFFVSARKSNAVYVYAYSQQKLIKKIEVGNYPQRMTKAIWQRGVASTAQAKVQTLDQYIQKAQKDWKVPGLAITVVKDGEVLHSKGYGIREVGKAETVNTKTLFGCMSTTKAMVAVGMGLLVDEGKVKWTDKVLQHLPNFKIADPYITKELTIRDLFTHNAGLGNADFLWAWTPDLSQEAILNRMQYAEPAYSFRGGYTYQNIMYLAAGKVIEKLTGKSWEAYTEEKIFAPLGMTHSFASMTRSKNYKNRSKAHFEIGNKIKMIAETTADPIAPAGAVWSNAEDLSLIHI